MTVYHFVGIKGTGMSPLAQILHDTGYQVQGSDIEKQIFTQAPLKKEISRSIRSAPITSNPA